MHHQNFVAPLQHPHQHCPDHRTKWAKGTRLLFPRVLQPFLGFLPFLAIAKEMIATAVIAPDRTLAFLFHGTALPLFLFSFFFYEGNLKRAFLFFLYGVNQALFSLPIHPAALFAGLHHCFHHFPMQWLKKGPKVPPWQWRQTDPLECGPRPAPVCGEPSPQRTSKRLLPQTSPVVCTTAHRNAIRTRVLY